VIALSSPLSSKLKSRSHCAVGNTNDIVLLSILVAHPDGITISNKSILYFPKPVAETAVSKSGGAIIEKYIYCKKSTNTYSVVFLLVHFLSTK
jgi:hypothetical protein